MNKRQRRQLENRVTYLRMILEIDSLFAATYGKRQGLAQLCIIEGAYGENTIVNGDWTPRHFPHIEVYLSPILTLDGLKTWTDGLIQGATMAPWN